MAGNGHRGHATEHQCCGVVQQAATDSRDRRNRRREKPQSWIVLKLTIGVTLGIIGYASYVYIGRFCEPMIRRNQGALGGRNFGSKSPSLTVFEPALAIEWFLVSPVLGSILYTSRHDGMGVCDGRY